MNQEAAVERRFGERRRTDRGGVDRREPAAEPEKRAVHIGSVGAAARELNRGMRVGRASPSWGRDWLTVVSGTPAGQQLVRHREGGKPRLWTLGAEDLLANDWVLWC